MSTPSEEAPVTIPFCVPEMTGNEAAYTADAIARNEPCQGDYLPRVEAAVAGYVGVRHAVAVSSGTAALHLALLAAGVGPGDEVIVPTLTFIATANAVRYCGATPVFVDVEPEHWGMDIQRARNVASARTAVKAILPVQLLGHPTKPVPLSGWYGDYRPAVIEDASESLGAIRRNYRAGSHELALCLSFNGNKLITTGGGGMVLTNNARVGRRVRYLANQAKDDPAEFVHRSVGYNYRMSNLAAAVGCAQMERIDEFLAAKRRIAETYSRELAGVPGIILPTEAPWARSSWWLWTMRVRQAEYGMDARALRARLAEQRIESRCLWQPLHLSPAYADCYRGPLPVAQAVWREALSLPSSVGLTESQQARVIESVRDARR